jgi:hypothetical protein
MTPARRGTGVGKGMLQTILKRVEEMEGLEQVLLSVAATQTAAFRLHCALGFELFGSEPRALKIGDRFIDEQYLVLRLKNGGASKKSVFKRPERESALDFSVQDASAALPQNCRTTRWIVGSALCCVNVTLVMN